VNTQDKKKQQPFSEQCIKGKKKKIKAKQNIDAIAID